MPYFALYTQARIYRYPFRLIEVQNSEFYPSPVFTGAGYSHARGNPRSGWPSNPGVGRPSTSSGRTIYWFTYPLSLEGDDDLQNTYPLSLEGDDDLQNTYPLSLEGEGWGEGE